jgi:glycosyltransferase involved in cell wall biosynthesis
LKITIINQFYPPDLSPTGKLAQSLAEHRAGQGDEITVIAGTGYAGPSQAVAVRDATTRSRSVNVWRIWTPRLGKASIWRRMTDYAVFFALTVWASVRLPRQDVIICLTTPPFIAIAGFMHKTLHPRTRLILWNMDCYPEVAERAGVIRPGGVMSRTMQFLNRCLESVLDHTICLDSAMRDLVLSRRSTRTKIRMEEESRTESDSERNSPKSSHSVISNWERSHSFPTGNSSRAASPDLVQEAIVLYSGNMGQGHCFETVLTAAQQLDDQNAPVRFIFTGGGGQSLPVQREVHRRQLRNVDFLGYVSDDKLRELQHSACCSLITLKDNMLGVMSPSKLHGNLAAGLPILYVGPRGSNVDDAIQRHQCGVSLCHGDTKRFIEFVNRLRFDLSVRAMYSKRARLAFEVEYSDQHGLTKFDGVIQSVVDQFNHRAVVDQFNRRAA